MVRNDSSIKSCCSWAQKKKAVTKESNEECHFIEYRIFLIYYTETYSIGIIMECMIQVYTIQLFGFREMLDFNYLV